MVVKELKKIKDETKQNIITLCFQFDSASNTLPKSDTFLDTSLKIGNVNNQHPNMKLSITVDLQKQKTTSDKGALFYDLRDIHRVDLSTKIIRFCSRGRWCTVDNIVVKQIDIITSILKLFTCRYINMRNWELLKNSVFNSSI